MSGGGEIIELTQVIREFIGALNQSQRAIESPSAFVEQRNVLQNNGPEVVTFQSTLWKGKNFPRGCFGHIHSLEIFARNRSLTDGTITFGFRAFPTGTEITTATIIVPGRIKGIKGTWHSIAVGWDWLFWGMFIYVKEVTENVQYAFDNAEVTNSEPDPKSDAYESTDLGVTWTGESDQRYWFRLNMYGQAKGELTIGGRVSINAIDKHVKVVLTDEDGNITGIGLPLNVTTIIGSDDTFFNNLIDNGEVQKSYSAGDTYTDDWIAGTDIYPYAVNIVFRALHSSNIRPPNFLEYDGIYVRITASDGQLLFDSMLGQDRNLTFNLMTWEGTLYWVATLRAELSHRRVSNDVTITLLLKNSSGATLDYIEPYILGVIVA